MGRPKKTDGPSNRKPQELAGQGTVRLTKALRPPKAAPLPREQVLHLYTPHPGQAPLHASAARFRIATCGRRFGKTLAAVNECAKAAWETPGAMTWWVAPTYDLTQIGFRLMARAFKAALKPDGVSKTERRMEWVNGSITLFRSADNWQNLVGEGLVFLIIDEAARVAKEAWEESLRPTLTDRKGRALIIGTPKGKNWFYHLWTRGQDPEQSDYESWQLPTSANPIIDPEEIELARQTLPTDVFRQEYEAAFLEHNAGVFRNIDGCVRAYAWPEPPKDADRYFAGLDLARLQDWTVLTILNQAGRLVYFDRFQKMDWEAQIARIVETVKRYRAKLLVDSTGVGDPIFERLYYSGLNVQPFRFGNENKRNLIEQLALGVERADLSFPDIPELVNELDIMEYDLGRTGLVRYAAPAGYHDDCVISLALAWESLGGVQAMEVPAAAAYQSVFKIRFGDSRGVY